MKSNMHRLKALEKIRNENFFAFEKIASYLNHIPTLLTKEIMDEISGGVAENEELCFTAFLSTALCENDKESSILEREYLKKSVKKLDPKEYYKNPYFKNIKIKEASLGEWNLGYQSYMPYEGFIYDDIISLPNHREIPRLGFFSEKFTFPTVFENGIEWMAIKPNEISTMAPHLEKMAGSVAIFGLGMGYFAYMASLKNEVSQITIVERDPNVISLFEKFIFPQFENKDKIKIVKSDAFDFVENEMPKHKFDCAFVDLWHDVSDGVELYIKMKKLEAKSPKTKFSYWIENSIISNIRWHIFDGIVKKYNDGKFYEPYESVQKYLSDEYLKEFVKFL